MSTISVPGVLLSFYEIDARKLGGPRYFVFDGLNEFDEDVTWSAPVDKGADPAPVTYAACMITATGFSYEGDGLPRPSVTLANVDGAIGKLAAFYHGLKGALFIRRQTFARYLDAANFLEGNPEADPQQFFPPDVFVISRMTSENRSSVSFECVSPIEIKNMQVPGRVVSATVCPFVYRSVECGYDGPLPTCDKGTKTPNGCQVHFGVGHVLRTGAFPGAGRNRR